MSRRWIFIALFIASAVAAAISGCTSSNGPAVYIAVAGADLNTPDNRPDSTGFYAGVQIAVDEFNRAGGLDGRAVVVLPPFPDQDDPDAAAEVAVQIARSLAVGVVGHTSPDATRAASTIYDRWGLPAIAVQPLPQETVAAHPYLFSVTYSADQEAAYVANYLRKVVHAENASVIYTDDDYGRALAHKFVNTFNGLGGDVDFQELIDPGQPDGRGVDAVIAKVLSLNPETQNPGTIFIAADPATTASVVIALRRNGLGYPLAGGSNISGEEFLDVVGAQSEVSAEPGYFTDGILTARAILFDSASDDASLFANTYRALYGSDEPGDPVVHGYDAALTLLAAIQRAGATGADITADRAAVYRALLQMADRETGVAGVTGALFFDPDGSVDAAPRFGLFQNGRMISAMSQFEPIRSAQQIRDLNAQLDRGRIATVNGEYVYVSNMVYAGVDLIDVQDIDIKTSTYKMDFYLWFRYRAGLQDGEFDPEKFVFTNQKGIESQELIREETLDGITYKTYRVIGTFKNEFDFHEYPFDRQSLVIEFRNQNASSSFIQYVVDRLGMEYNNDDELARHFDGNGAFNGLYGWSVRSAHAQQNIFSTTSTIGDPQNFGRDATTDFSLINLSVELQRDSLDYIIKSLLPLLLTLVLAYIMLYLPLGHSERLAVGSTALLATAFFHLTLTGSLPEIGYTVAMEYFFYAAYVMSALIVLLETLSVRLEKKSEQVRSKSEKKSVEIRRERLNRTGRILYPSIMAAVVIAGVLVYKGNIRLAPARLAGSTSLGAALAAQAHSSGQLSQPTPIPPAAADRQIVLRLRTWRPEDARQMQLLLDAFHEFARTTLDRDITIAYDPVVGVSYDDILETQLSSGDGPDLFFVRPYSVNGRIVHDLLSLNDLEIETEFEVDRRAPWQAATGSYYALPYVGVVQGVYYNKSILAELELSVPTTWEDFLATAEAIKAAGITPIANGLNLTEDSEMFMSLAPNFIGGESGRKQFMSAQDVNLCFNNYRVIRAFRAIEEVRPFLPANAATIQSSASKELFLNQQAAMLFGGSWDLRYFQENVVFDWSIFPVPAPKSATTYVIFQPDVGIGINRATAYPEEAKAFLRWLMSPAAINLTARNLPGFYPLSNTRVSGSSDPYDLQFQRMASQFPTDIRWAYTEISQKVPSGIELFRVNLHRIVRSEIKAAEAAQNLQAGLGEWYEPAQTCR